MRGYRPSGNPVDLLETGAHEAGDAVIDRVYREADRRPLENGLDVLVPLPQSFLGALLLGYVQDDAAGADRATLGAFPGKLPEAEAMDRVRAEPKMAGADLAREVTPGAPVLLDPLTDTAGPTIAAIDTGIKDSIVRHLRERGARLELHPCTTSADDLLPGDADAFFLANGPGDPAALGYVVDTVRELIGKRPVFGICLGHQLLCRAVGLETTKLPFGHRGANHPVKDLETGRIDITSQNHGFAVAGTPGEIIESELGAAQLTHVNLYDNTIEGIRLLDVPAGCVQYHPEAGPGPNDSLGLFDEFIELFAHAA
jgi:carbamoyl-phosphate synthase small subunit